MKKSTLIFLSLLILSPRVFPQQYIEKTYGGFLNEKGTSCEMTADSGYVLVGQTSSFGSGLNDIYLVRVISSGDTLWTKTFGGTEDDYANSVKIARNGDILIAGTMTLSGSTDIFVIRTDSNGNSLWAINYGGSGRQNGYDIVETPDSGLLILGDKSNQLIDIYLIKTDAQGTEQNNYFIGGTVTDIGYSIHPTKDNGYIIGGSTSSSGNGKTDMYVVKLNANLDTLWTRTYGGAEVDVCYDVSETLDGGYLLAGNTSSFSIGQTDVWVIKINSTGDSLWSHTYGKSEAESCNSVKPTPDGGFVLAGYSYSHGNGSSDMYLIKIDSVGTEEWFQSFGGSLLESATDVIVLANDEYVVTGSTETFGAGGSDFFWVKTPKPQSVGVGSLSPLANSIQIYPNPVSKNESQLTVYIPFSSEGQLGIFSLDGREIYTTNNLSTNSVVIPVVSISPGYYFVRWKDKSMVSVSKLVIVE